MSEENMDEDEALNSLRGLAATLFLETDQAWAFEVRHEDLHAVCVRCPDDMDVDEALDWIVKRIGGLHGDPGFFLPGFEPGEVLLMTVRAKNVDNPVSAELRLKQAVVIQQVPVLVLHRPGRVLN